VALKGLVTVAPTGILIAFAVLYFSVSRTLCVPVVSRLFGRGVAVCGHRPVVRTSE